MKGLLIFVCVFAFLVLVNAEEEFYEKDYVPRKGPTVQEERGEQAKRHLRNAEKFTNKWNAETEHRMRYSHAEQERIIRDVLEEQIDTILRDAELSARIEKYMQSLLRFPEETKKDIEEGGEKKNSEITKYHIFKDLVYEGECKPDYILCFRYISPGNTTNFDDPMIPIIYGSYNVLIFLLHVSFLVGTVVLFVCHVLISVTVVVCTHLFGVHIGVFVAIAITVAEVIGLALGVYTRKNFESAFSFMYLIVYCTAKTFYLFIKLLCETFKSVYDQIEQQAGEQPSENPFVETSQIEDNACEKDINPTEKCIAGDSKK